MFIARRFGGGKMHTIFILIAFAGVFIWSFCLRLEKLRHVPENLATKPSIFSLAIQELIAVAGGIYLSLVMLVSFLKLEVPEKFTFGAIAVDPLACSAIFLTMIQPIINKIVNKFNRE
jgi:hypothetical protein